MVRMLCVFSAALLTAEAALASETAADETGKLAGFTETGETVSCVSMRSASIDPIDDGRLLFKVGARYYLNETRGNCSRAESPFSRIELTLFGPRACQGESLRVVDNNSGMFEGACTLGDFRRLEKRPASPPAAETQ